MKIDIGVIEKVLDNKATPEEAQAVAKWFAEDEGNHFLSDYMDKQVKNLDKSEILSWLGDEKVPEEQLGMKILYQIRSRRMKTVRRRRMLVAAIIIPFLFLSMSTIFFMERSGVFAETVYTEIYVPCGERMQVVLQDGTVVLLNSDTKLRYPQKFSLFHREVELFGEGYFNVSKMKNCPFIVNLNGLKVEVTGTKFNVKSYPDDQNVWVVLEEGHIKVVNDKNWEYALEPNDKVVYNRIYGTFSVEQLRNLEREFAWHENYLNFYMTPLGEILKVLRRQYNVQFIVKDSVALNSRFTLSTAKIDVTGILEDLEHVSHVSFKNKGNGIFEVFSTMKEK